MTNESDQTTSIGHWCLVIGHFAQQLFVFPNWGFELILLLRLLLRFRLPAVAADHRDAAGADQLQDAVGPHPLDESFDLALAAGDFDHQLFRADIDDPRPKNLDQLADFAPLGPRWRLDLEQHQIPLDIVTRANVIDLDDRDDLLKL